MSTVQCPNGGQRTSQFAVFGKYFGLFSASARFDAIRRLLSSSPIPTVSGLLIRQLKSEVDGAWPNVAESQESTSFFCSRKLLELFPIFMTATNLTERNEVVLEALNLYRYLLIKDKATNYTGLWNVSQVNEVDIRFLTPLKGEVSKMRNSFSSARTDAECLERIEGMKKLGLPALTVGEFRKSNFQAITNVMLLEDLVDRIRELIKTLPDKE